MFNVGISTQLYTLNNNVTVYNVSTYLFIALTEGQISSFKMLQLTSKKNKNYIYISFQ